MPSDFDFAAELCGHDTSTATGASDARHDHRVWDVLDSWSIQAHIANARRILADAEQYVVRP